MIPVEVDEIITVEVADEVRRIDASRCRLVEVGNDVEELQKHKFPHDLWHCNT